MRASQECIAIVVSAPGIDRPTRQQAELANRLSDAKIRARQDIVSVDRLADANRLLVPGMRVLFHQGGAPSIWQGKVPNVGCVVATGYLGGIMKGMQPWGSLIPNADLLRLTRMIFQGWTLGGWLWFTEVKWLSPPVLTKSFIGRPLRPREDYIVVCPGDTHFARIRAWLDLCEP